VPGRYLTEEDERAESEARERLRHAQFRLRELRDRRGLLIQQIRQLSDEQHAIHERMDPERGRVEDAHAEYRDLGRKMAELRDRREAMRPRLEAAFAATRRPVEPRGDRPGGRDRRSLPPRPDQIRREMALLERQQQTQALSLTEENALIDRLRELRKSLEVAEKAEGERAAVEAGRKAQEVSFRELRAEFDRLGEEMRRLRSERDAKMASMRDRLAAVGQEIGQIREKARARAELFRRTDEVNRQIAEVDAEIRATLTDSRARRQEAHQTIQEYNRSARESVAGSVVAAQAADEQFEQLMKNGKVSLGG
jgi:uncharacterized coiled-coil DUF342 family protein